MIHTKFYFTAGTKVNDSDCKIPDLGLRWHSFLPPIFLDDWPICAKPASGAPITSVTQWNWASGFQLGERVYSDSKRDAYLNFLTLPRKCNQTFVLAANISANDDTGDVELLKSNKWNLVSPHRVARSPQTYRSFIASSLCEFGCAKPIYTDLKTGWFSERSATYLACGRPVLAQETGFSDHIATGAGLFSFSTIAEAIAAIEELTANYAFHRKAARELAEANFSATRVLSKMIDEIGS